MFANLITHINRGSKAVWKDRFLENRRSTYVSARNSITIDDYISYVSSSVICTCMLVMALKILRA